MRKIKYVLLLCLLVVVTTGCVKFNANMDIKKDKSMDFSIIYAFDKTIFGGENGMKLEEFKELEKDGFTVSEYVDGNMEGVSLLKKIINIDEVSTESDTEYDLSGMMNSDSNNKYFFKVKKGLIKNTYMASFKFDANDSGLNEENNPDEEDNLFTLEGNDSINYSNLMANMDLSFNVNLPYSALSNNATKTEDDNRKLTWSLSTNNAVNINFAFEIYNMKTIYIGIGIILVLIILVIFLLTRKGKKKEIIMVNDTQTRINNDIKDDILKEPILNNNVNIMENDNQNNIV